MLLGAKRKGFWTAHAVNASNTAATAILRGPRRNFFSTEASMLVLSLRPVASSIARNWLAAKSTGVFSTFALRDSWFMNFRDRPKRCLAPRFGHREFFRSCRDDQDQAGRYDDDCFQS